MGLKDIWHRMRNVAAAPPTGAEPAAQDPAAEIPALQVKLGYEFRRPALLQKALLHRSHNLVTQQSRLDSNERLEFLGDAVLGLVVGEALFRRNPDATEGDLTKMKSLLVCRERLAEVAANLDLGGHIRMSRSEAATGGRRRSSILADTTEALIGAVYLDGGLAAAERVVTRWVLAGFEDVLARRSKHNYKSRLQEYIQARYKSPPRYRVLSADGPDHDRVFRVSVTHDGTTLGYGEGPNKKTAEQQAAREALARIERDPDLLEKPSGEPGGGAPA